MLYARHRAHVSNPVPCSSSDHGSVDRFAAGNAPLGQILTFCQLEPANGPALH